MHTAQHLIQRATLEFAVASREGVYELQEEARRILLGDASRAMDEVLSRFAQDEVIVLDRIQIDAGVFDSGNIAGELTERLRVGLEEALAREVPRVRAAGGKGRVLRRAASRVELLQHFLVSGQLPWWTPGSSSVNPEEILLAVLEESPQELKAMLDRQDPETLGRRIARQFSPAAISRLLALLAPQEHHALSGMIEEWVRLARDMLPVPSQEAEVLVWQRALAVILASGHPGRIYMPDAIFSALSQTLRLPPETCRAHLAQVATTALREDSPLRQWIERSTGFTPAGVDVAGEPLPSSGQHVINEDQKVNAANEPRKRHQHDGTLERSTASGKLEPAVNGGPADLPSSVGSHPGAPSQGANLESASFRAPALAEAGSAHSGAAAPQEHQATAITMSAKPHPVELREDVFYIENAGLVLLWPFLPRFFKAIGLVEEERFITPAAQERAVLLLQYLVSGRAEAPEHVLILNKILCGWPLSQPVIRTLEPSAIELAECTELLTSVIAHWAALKGTSVEGFRSAFLRREGRLMRGETGWRLLIQRAAFDVLLDTLPWAIGLMVLPWMEPLYVEW